MAKYRPLGVTILAVIIILTYSVIFFAALAVVLLGVSNIPRFLLIGGLLTIAGIIFMIWAFLRLSVGFGLLRMKRKAWKSAMIIFGIGLLIDLFIAPGQVLLDIIIIVYLIIVKRHFI